MASSDPRLLNTPVTSRLMVAGALNKGLSNTESEYIAVLDDDDTWHPEFLMTTVKHLEECRCKGVVTASEIIYEKINASVVKTIKRRPYIANITSISLFMLLGRNYFPINSFVYLRDTIKKIGQYDQNASPVEDWDFIIRFIAQYDIEFINQTLSYYHQRPDSVKIYGNSIFRENTDHWRSTYYVLNKYLRQDLKKISLV